MRRRERRRRTAAARTSEPATTKPLLGFRSRVNCQIYTESSDPRPRCPREVGGRERSERGAGRSADVGHRQVGGASDAVRQIHRHPPGQATRQRGDDDLVDLLPAGLAADLAGGPSGQEQPDAPSSRCGPEPWPRASSCPGFSDLELALLVEAGLIGTDTVVATTVHPLQVLEEGLPETGHDFRLDVVVAGEEVIGCRRTRQPPGIIWEHLDPAKVAAIPALAARVRQHGTL